MTSWVSRSPVATFVALTMAWSFPIWSLMWLFLAPGGLAKDPPPVCFVFVVLGGFGPSLAGALTTWLVDGASGLRALWGRVRGRGVGWWWLTVLLIPAVTALTPVLRRRRATRSMRARCWASWAPGSGWASRRA